MFLEVQNLEKIYLEERTGRPTRALQKVTFSVKRGEFIAVMGESGSGKTTLLNLLATLDEPTAGHIYLEGEEVSRLDPGQKERFRRTQLGFVFQEHALLDTCSVKDNIALPLVLEHESLGRIERRIQEVAQQTNTTSLLTRSIHELSGGERARVALARALSPIPALILADEPTGALDSAASAALLDLLEQCHRLGQTLLMVTHSALAASRASRVLFIRDGMLFHEIYRGESSSFEFVRRIHESLSVLFSRSQS
ncbi:ABC transporter ATP-binding protein [Clostridiaceae bacterium JG1575]|nr:ABC transporter ATP-binding protein [Clostridiaceae bacterium JG1575]